MAPHLPVGERSPVATHVLVAVLALMFGVEVLMAESRWTMLFDIPIDVLAAAGASSGAMVVNGGESFRLWSAMFLHGDLIHLAMNVWCLYQAGSVLEPLIGRLRYLAVFVVSGFIGSLTSVIINPDNVVGVGASGGAMGLLAAAFFAALRFPKTPQRDEVMAWSAGLVVLNVLPVRSGIDYAAHAGGAVGGVLAVAALIGYSRRLILAPALERETHGLLLSAGGVLTVLTLIGATSEVTGAGSVAGSGAAGARSEWSDRTTSTSGPVPPEVPYDAPLYSAGSPPTPIEDVPVEMVAPSVPDVTSAIVGEARGALASGGLQLYRLPLLEGARYEVRSWCDQDCVDLDLEVVRSDGMLLGKDLAVDAQPVVSFLATQSGTAEVRVRMVQCTVAPCTFQVELRENRPNR